jgi:RNA polymerase sigma-70 factor (ECF subfamily)
MVPLDAENADELPASPETPETVLISNAERQLLQEALEALPLHFREILLLCETEEMSYQEISETLSVPIGTVMSRLSRARKALRDIVKQKSVRASHG